LKAITYRTGSLFPELDAMDYENAEKQFSSLVNQASRYSDDEAEFQKAQEHWDKHGDLKSWQKMYEKIQKACFNCINKKLVSVIPKDEIESYSHDVTISILNVINKKRLLGKFWKIARLSAFVYLPCKSIYQKQNEFEDRVLDESAYTTFKDGKETVKEKEDSFFKDGIFHI
jgi:hypothetical protein